MAGCFARLRGLTAAGLADLSGAILSVHSALQLLVVHMLRMYAFGHWFMAQKQPMCI